MSRSIIFLIVIFSFFSCKHPIGNKTTDNKVVALQYPVEPLNESPALIHKWQQELQTHFENLNRFAHFNGNVLIARRGNVIYSGSFGVKNLDTKDSLDIHSLFQIASVSKTFTAMAVMKLVEEGKLDIHQKVEAFFPKFPYPGITIQDLLSHRSGLPNYLVVTEKDWAGQGLKSNADLLQYFIQKKPKPLGLPNKSFAYNNSNYAILALIIEKVSGMSFEDFMQEKIFNPLGMKHTYIFSAKHHHLPQENLTSGYLRKSEKDHLYAVDGVVGDKNIYTDVHDLLIWERANTHDYFFHQSTLDSVVVGRSNEKPGRKNYGYGWRLLDDPEKGKLVFHNGWWHGYTAVFYRNPQDETVIIILSNIFSRSTYRIQPIWDILYGTNNYTEDDFNGL